MSNYIKPSHHNKNDLRDIFIQKYGVSMEIPAFYYYNAKFVPNKPNYLVTMSFHIIPKKQSMLGNVQTTFIDGTVEESSYEDLYQNTGENIIMNLSRQNGRKGIENI